MKKLLAIILTVVMILSMSITAFAAEETGSITITNATADVTYTVYKIFDATYSGTISDGNAEAVSYTIETTDQFFDDLFGTDGKTANEYFAYNAETGAVSKRAGVQTPALVAYLTELVSGATSAATPIKAEAGKAVKFDNLPYGYYVVTSTLGATVTINSNTPDVEVIDKNQKPATDFNKTFSDGAVKNSANIGDKIDYKISFTATNYDGDSRIKFYQIYDELGKGLTADFSTISITVGDTLLTQGYYLDKTGDEAYLGIWTGEKGINNAEWYLRDLGNNTFRVTIPWLTELTMIESRSIYELNFGEGAESKFASPVEVVFTYSATVQADAVTGGGVDNNLENTANALWTSESKDGSTPSKTVETETFGIGLQKIDPSSKENLAGAKFQLYSDDKCTTAVNVKETAIKGVYMHDATGSNEVVSQINGKLVILGLKEGTYYLKEVEAPAGYNSLTAPISVTVGTGHSAFTVYANASGEVANILQATSEYQEYIYNVTHTTVENSKGVELPATGGEGATMLITIGAIIAMAFAVLLITQKKMSIYKD